MRSRALAPRLQCSAEEWTARVQLAACYRIFAYLGWVELIYNHITLRLAGPDKHFLINPFGLMYSEVRASNLVKIDLKGNVVGYSDWPVNPAGFTVHAAIHDGVPGAHCVMHTHTTAGMAVACARSGLSMSNFYSAQLHGKLAYHDFEGITVHPDEGPRPHPQHRRQTRGHSAQSRSARVGGFAAEDFRHPLALEPGLRDPARLHLDGRGDRHPGGHPGEVHARLAAVQFQVRRRPGCVRRADAHDRSGGPVLSAVTAPR